MCGSKTYGRDVENVEENLHIKAQVGSLDLSKENTTWSLALSEDGGKEVGH